MRINNSDSAYIALANELGLKVTENYFVLGYKNYTLHDITSPGETNGLLLTLNVQTDEYLEKTSSIGVKVQIHDQDEPILIREKGFAVMPGRKALVSVKKKEVSYIYFTAGA